MSEENKRVVRRLLEEVWGKGNLSVLPEVLARDCISHAATAGFRLKGIDQYRQFVATYQALLGDAGITIEDQLAEGDRVATRWTTTIRLPMEADAIAPQPASVIAFHRLAGGKIVETWSSWDVMVAEDLAAEHDVLDSLTLDI
ncbi:MAG: ester cyclase [Woeseiaceae bacterium]|jgi:predicted ester cyclase|nr:ester cyclase [Woeseiaceae bacterium]